MRNFKNSLLYLMVAALSLEPIAILAHQPNEPAASQEVKIPLASEDLIKDTYNYLNRLAFVFGELATLVQNDSGKDKESKDRLQHEILSSRKEIIRISRDLDNNPTLIQVELTLELAARIVAELERALQTKLETYATPEAQTTPTRSINLSDLPQEPALALTLKKSMSLLESVQKRAESTGLYWYNRLYRNTVDRFVVQPCEKYNLHWKAFYVTVATAAAAYIWFHANKSTQGVEPIDLVPANFPLSPEEIPVLQKTLEADAEAAKTETLLWQVHRKINGLIRSWLGWPVISDRNTMTDITESSLPHRIGTFGQFEKALWDAKIGYWSFGALCYEPVRTFITKKYKDAKEYISNKLSGAHNYLKGGAFYQRYKNKTGHLGRIEPRYTFDDIIGFEHAKDILGNVIKYMKSPESYDRAGLTPAKGYLLVGPPRTGKTMLAEALAGEVKRALGSDKKLPFYPIEARWIAEQGNFDTLIQIMKEHAPCIIFIDEIDMLNLHRDKHADKNILLSEFLSTLSGCMNSDPDKQVIIIAATNKPENLDTALRARFGCTIPFVYPSFMERAEFFARALEARGMPFEQFNIKRLTELTDGCSFEMLHKMINHAQFVIRDQGRPVTQEDIERSLNSELFGIMHQEKLELPQDEQAILAVHMAGHAIAYSTTGESGVRMAQVTIHQVSTSKLAKDPILSEALKDEVLPHIVYGHVFTHHKPDSLKFVSKQEMERLCIIELAGHMAEELIFGTHHITKNTCSHNDRSKAFYWACKHELDGLNENLIARSPSMLDDMNKRAYAFMKACEEKARELLSSRVELIKMVAELLLHVGSLGPVEMEEIIKLHTMLGGKTIEEFVAENQKNIASQDAATESESTELDELPVVTPKQPDELS